MRILTGAADLAIASIWVVLAWTVIRIAWRPRTRERSWLFGLLLVAFLLAALTEAGTAWILLAPAWENDTVWFSIGAARLVGVTLTVISLAHVLVNLPDVLRLLILRPDALRLLLLSPDTLRLLILRYEASQSDQLDSETTEALQKLRDSMTRVEELKLQMIEMKRHIVELTSRGGDLADSRVLEVEKLLEEARRIDASTKKK